MWQGGVKWGLVAGPSGPLASQASTEQAISCLSPSGVVLSSILPFLCLRMPWGGLLVSKVAGAH